MHGARGPPCFAIGNGGHPPSACRAVVPLHQRPPAHPQEADGHGLPFFVRLLPCNLVLRWWLLSLCARMPLQSCTDLLSTVPPSPPPLPRQCHCAIDAAGKEPLPFVSHVPSAGGLLLPARVSCSTQGVWVCVATAYIPSLVFCFVVWCGGPTTWG